MDYPILSNNSNKCFFIALHWPSLNLKVTRKQYKSVNTCLISESMLNIKITQFIRSNGADHLWHVIFITPVTRKEKTQLIGRGNQSNALNLSIWRHLKSFLPCFVLLIDGLKICSCWQSHSFLVACLFDILQWIMNISSLFERKTLHAARLHAVLQIEKYLKFKFN